MKQWEHFEKVQKQVYFEDFVQKWFISNAFPMQEGAIKVIKMKLMINKFSWHENGIEMKTEGFEKA